MTARSFTSLLVLGVVLLNIVVAAMVALMLYQSRADARQVLLNDLKSRSDSALTPAL